jgi:outer membrane protein OmpA-like peptidoglycan-associated protein
VGSADYNMNLSVQRAQEAQLILQAATSASNLKGVEYRTNGHGNTNAPFPNTLPEERFYNRTVVIDVIPNGSVAQK